MMVYTDGRGYVRQVWAMVCKSWGIHGIAQTKREAKAADAHQAWGHCGPHRLVKLSLKSKG